MGRNEMNYLDSLHATRCGARRNAKCPYELYFSAAKTTARRLTSNIGVGGIDVERFIETELLIFFALGWSNGVFVKI